MGARVRLTAGQTSRIVARGGGLLGRGVADASPDAERRSKSLSWDSSANIIV